MNLSNFLPGFLKKDDDGLPDDIALAAEERAERIRFHRTQVRNGPWTQTRRGVRSPADFVYSAGQANSKARRRAKAGVEKANRNARRDFIRVQHNLARLRGQLEVVGALPQTRRHLEVVPMPSQAEDGTPIVVDQEVVRRTELTMVDHPLRRNGLQGLFDGYAAAAMAQHDLDELDIDNVEHQQIVIGFALHHYRLATRSAA